MTTLHIERLAAGYGANQVIRDFSLSVDDGELVALLGPSGCGKTTILKLIAGLLHPNGGDMRFNDASILPVPAERRGAAMVFQKPLLFPFLTVAENVAFGLKMRGLGKREIEQRVGESLRLVQLEGYEKRRPGELSGGQEQRVSLARALITEPRLLLLDEPFSALDESLRAGMRQLVRDLQRRLNITTLFVTHDQAEAATIADRIALILGGRLEQYSPPRDFYLSPATAGAAEFFGWQLITGSANGHIFETDIGRFLLRNPAIDEPRTMAWQTEQARLRKPGLKLLADTTNNIVGTIAGHTDLGTRVRYRVRLRSGDFIELEQRVQADDQQPYAIGSEVIVHIPGHATVFFTS